MTKKLNMVVSATAAMVLLLSITGCSFGGPGTNTEQTQKSDSSETSKEKEKAEKEKEKQEKAEQKQREALDDYVDAESEQLPAVMAAYPGVYSDITAEAKYPGTVVFSYTYEQQVDPATAVAHFESMIPTLQDACDQQIFPSMESAGVKGDKYVDYIYINADGSEIWSHTFESS